MASSPDAIQASQPWLSSFFSVHGSTVSENEPPVIRATATENYHAVHRTPEPMMLENSLLNGCPGAHAPRASLLSPETQERLAVGELHARTLIWHLTEWLGEKQEG